ncbi:MAG: hypothetical protein M3042_00955 [Actinomycetota bacterium]|nr:hypothetical protein [Actinomycetota bacterium]
MCCEQLICARCAGPVAEARCPVCRSARAGLHGAPAFPAQAMLVLTVLVLLLVTLAAQGRLH